MDKPDISEELYRRAMDRMTASMDIAGAAFRDNWFATSHFERATILAAAEDVANAKVKTKDEVAELVAVPFGLLVALARGFCLAIPHIEAARREQLEAEGEQP